MLGETQKPILPHPRSAQYMRAPKKQFPISREQLDAVLQNGEARAQSLRIDSITPPVGVSSPAMLFAPGQHADQQTQTKGDTKGDAQALIRMLANHLVRSFGPLDQLFEFGKEFLGLRSSLGCRDRIFKSRFHMFLQVSDTVAPTVYTYELRPEYRAACPQVKRAPPPRVCTADAPETQLELAAFSEILPESATL